MEKFSQDFFAGFSSVMGPWYSLKADAERWGQPQQNKERFPVLPERKAPGWFDFELSAFAMGAQWAEDHFDEIAQSLRKAGHPVPEDAAPNGWSDEGENAFGSTFWDCFEYHADRDSDAPFGAAWTWNRDFWVWFNPAMSPCEMAEAWFEKCRAEIDDLSDDEEETDNEEEVEDEAVAEDDGINLRIPTSMSDYYYQGPSDTEPWEAFFELHLTGEQPELSVGRQYGGGQPADVAAGRTLRFDFPADSSLGAVRACMQEIAPLCASLAETWDTKWHGGNEVGVYDEDAKAAVQEAVNDYFDPC